MQRKKLTLSFVSKNFGNIIHSLSIQGKGNHSEYYHAIILVGISLIKSNKAHRFDYADHNCHLIYSKNEFFLLIFVFKNCTTIVLLLILTLFSFCKINQNPPAPNCKLRYCAINEIYWTISTNLIRCFTCIAYKENWKCKYLGFMKHIISYRLSLYKCTSVTYGNS